MKIRTIATAAGVLAGLAVAGTLLRRSRGGAPLSNLGRDQQQRLLFAIENAFGATLRAYEVDDDTTDFEARDARATEAASALTEAVEAVRPSLGSLEAACTQLVELVSSAQLQLMAYAINRKNRGTPDSAAIETETTERRSFKRDAGPVYEGLIAALR